MMRYRPAPRPLLDRLIASVSQNLARNGYPVWRCPQGHPSHHTARYCPVCLDDFTAIPAGQPRVKDGREATRSHNHPQQVAKRGQDVDTDDRATTADVFGPLDARFHFSIDVAAAAHNTKCTRYYDVAADGLSQSWADERVWCNPPYSAMRPWVEKAWTEHRHAECIVMLAPANRTEQMWWQELVEPYRDRSGSALTVEFLPGRLRFLAPGQRRIGANERPPFGCVLLIWQHHAPSIDQGRMDFSGAA